MLGEKAMANPKHVELLRRDVDLWNEWRAEHPEVRPDLAGAELDRLDLSVANLAGANLAGASLILANLRGADLRGADLRGANLVGARMIGVDLEGADLRGADLRTAEDLTEEQLEMTRGDEFTVLPEGVGRPASWGAARAAG
jgi:hypothetical protein